MRPCIDIRSRTLIIIIIIINQHPPLSLVDPGTLEQYASKNWQFLVAVLVVTIGASIIITLLAKCHVVRKYVASYRHTRLKETDTVSQCEPSGGLGCQREKNPAQLFHTLEHDFITLSIINSMLTGGAVMSTAGSLRVADAVAMLWRQHRGNNMAAQRQAMCICNCVMWRPDLAPYGVH